MGEQTVIRPGQARPVGTAVLVRAVLAAVAAEMAGAVLAGGLRLALRGTLRAVLAAVRTVRAHWYRVCGVVLVTAAVAGLVAMLAGPLLAGVR